MRRSLITALVALALLGAACSNDDNGTVANDDATTTTAGHEPLEGPEGFTPEPIDWSDCGGAECATVEVPLDYDEPDGEHIELGVHRVPASGDRIGPLFVNPGGPGATATDFAETLANQLPDAITERFDFVGIDPRGVGESAPVSCGIPVDELYSVDASIDAPEDAAALLDTTNRYVADCEEKFGDVLPHLGTREVARDMDTVRAAMGDEHLSYLGFSYGTSIGQVYADLFPGNIRSMVIDGVVELGASGLELADEQAAGFEQALAAFIADCNADAGCSIGPDAEAAVDRVLQLAEQGDGLEAPDADRPMGPGEANLGIGVALYSKESWPILQDALAVALDGDGSQIVRLADFYLEASSSEIYFAVNCLDQSWPTEPDAIMAAAKATARKSPHLGEALVNDYIRCAVWPTPPQPLEPVVAPDAPPILVVSTTGDPATPYAAGVEVAETLANGILVTNEGSSHTVVSDGKPCIDDIVVAYLIDQTVPEDGVRCP